jgi:hypothetical protein
MVFAPTREQSPHDHEPAAAPKRPDHVDPPAARDADHGRWRVVVHALDNGTVQTSWHLAECSAPHDPAAHCAHGRQGLESLGDPDGHCLIDGTCPRCTLASDEPDTGRAPELDADAVELGSVGHG